MCENDLRNEILQSTQRLMNQIDQIKPIEINPDEIEKSQAFINRIENEQIQNIEKSRSLLRDVTDWGDKRKDQYDEFEKPLLKTVEKSVHVSEEVAKSALPLLQEKINNYDRRIGDVKSSIASMSDALSKTAKETYEMIKNGNDHNSKPEESTPFFQFSLSNIIPNENNEDSDNGNTQQKNTDDTINSDASFDMIQSMKLREEHLLNVVQSLSNEVKALKSSIKTEQSLSKNFHFELEYMKNHSYSPTLSIDLENSIQYEQFKNFKLKINSNDQNNNNNLNYEIPLVVIQYKDQNEGTDDLEKNEEKTEDSNPKIIIYQNFEICDIDPNENCDLLKNRIINEVKADYLQGLKNQSIQKEEENNYNISSNNCIESFEVADINSTFVGFNDNIGKVTITKEKGSNHHIFNYSENMNSEQAADDLDELINLHRSCKNNENEDENEYEEEDSNEESKNQSQNDENDIKLQKLKIITDFKHAAKIVYNKKTGKREIVTEKGIRLELTPTNDSNNNLYRFISTNGQNLDIVLIDQTINNAKSENDININLSNDEVVENKDIYIANEKNENGDEIKLQVIINKEGESYVTNNDSENNSRLFFDYNGCTFIYDNSDSVQIPVVMNDTGQIMYQMANNEFIQVAMMNIQSELFYINENGEKMLMKIDENGNFYVLSRNGKRIPINLFKNLNESDQINTENNTTKNQNETQDVQQEKDETIDENNDKVGISSNLNTNDSNNLPQDRLIPISISRKDNELKIIYKDNEDAVVVNTSISHTTQDGQIILRPNTTIDPHQNKNLDINLAIKGVKFNFNNDNPGTRVTRIVGGFNKKFMRQSRRKKFNWSVRPSYQIVKLNIKPQPPRCYFHNPAKGRHITNANSSNYPHPIPSTAKEVNKNTSLRWIAFPVRPPPLYCRKSGHLDLSVTGISSITGTSISTTTSNTTSTAEGNRNQIKDQQYNINQYHNVLNDHSDKPKYIFNKRKIVQPDSKTNRGKMIQDQNLFKSEQSQRKIFNNVSRNQKFTASPSPRRPLQRQQMSHFSPVMPQIPLKTTIQPAPRIKFNAGADLIENENRSDVND